MLNVFWLICGQRKTSSYRINAWVSAPVQETLGYNQENLLIRHPTSCSQNMSSKSGHGPRQKLSHHQSMPDFRMEADAAFQAFYGPQQHTGLMRFIPSAYTCAMPRHPSAPNLYGHSTQLPQPRAHWQETGQAFDMDPELSAHRGEAQLVFTVLLVSENNSSLDQWRLLVVERVHDLHARCVYLHLLRWVNHGCSKLLITTLSIQCLSLDLANDIRNNTDPLMIFVMPDFDCRHTEQDVTQWSSFPNCGVWSQSWAFSRMSGEHACASCTASKQQCKLNWGK